MPSRRHSERWCSGYTKDSSGIGADVDIQINTFASGVSTQLATLRTQAQNQVDNLNSPDATVWFTKGSKLVDVEVNKGTPGAALTLAKIVAGKE